MICNSKEILNQAKKNKYAIPQFNINNLEWIKYILEECDLNNSPVILGVTEKTIKYMGGYNTVANLIRNLDKELDIQVPVVIHLDHGKTIESCKKAIDNGFTSVMIDASHMNLEENIKITKEVVSYAEKFTATVEAELGNIGENSDFYTNVDEAKIFVEETNIDSLAPSIGTVHGRYMDIPKLDLDLCSKINHEVNIPLVLHGGSGLDDKILKETIKNGICKININTDLQINWAKEVKKFIIENPSCYDPRMIIGSGEKEIKRIIKEKINVLKSNI